MKITFFLRSPKAGVSIGKAFKPLIREIGKTEEIEVFYLPSERFTPVGIFRNLLFTFKHRNRNGINHLTGDCQYIILALIGCKSVLTVHDLGIYMYPMYSAWKKRLFYWLCLYWPIKKATKVIAISEKTKQDIENVVPYKRDIAVVKHHSIDEFKFCPKELDPNHVLIMHSGTEPRKNLETTMRAVAKLGYELRVIRKMSEEQVRLANELGLKYTNVYDLTDDEIIAQNQESDIVCFPSLYEGLGAIILEAQATGRPVITSQIEPMISVAGGGAYLLKDPTDENELIVAIKTIVEDSGYRRELIALGRKNASKYSLANCAKEHIDFYHKMWQ